MIFIIDGIMGERGIGEMTLIHQNIQNCMNYNLNLKNPLSL